MNLIDYIQFTKKPTGDYDLVYEHAEMPTFQFAYYFEVLLNPGHPDHETVKEFAQEIQDRAREEKMEMGRESMRQTRAAMSDDEWSLIVD